jgi:glucokinase
LRGFERALAKALRAIMREAARRGLKVKIAGIGCAGRIDMRRGIVKRSPNLAFLEGYEIGRRVEKLTDAQVFVANDVLTALYGEARLGVARKARHVIGVWIGTGVGGALIVDGRLHLGAAGIAGDLGNYMLHAMDADKGLQRKEVLDNVASRPAIAGDAAVLAAKQRAPSLRKAAGTDVKDIRSGDLANSIRAGDRDVENLVRSRAGVLGTAISNLVDFLNPDMVVLGGGLVSAMPQLMRSEIAKAIEAHASPGAAKAVKVAVAKFNDHAGTIGAAVLAADMFSKRPPIDLG